MREPAIASIPPPALPRAGDRRVIGHLVTQKWTLYRTIRASTPSASRKPCSRSPQTPPSPQRHSLPRRQRRRTRRGVPSLATRDSGCAARDVHRDRARSRRPPRQRDVRRLTGALSGQLTPDQTPRAPELLRHARHNGSGAHVGWSRAARIARSTAARSAALIGLQSCSAAFAGLRASGLCLRWSTPTSRATSATDVNGLVTL
jgi:hypothetical protein